MPGIETRAPLRTETSSGSASIAEALSGTRFQLVHCALDLTVEAVGKAFALLVEAQARLGRDREAGGHRQSGAGHLGKARAFTAEQLFHRAVAFFEEIDILRHRNRDLNRTLDKRRFHRERPPVLYAIPCKRRFFTLPDGPIGLTETLREVPLQTVCINALLLHRIALANGYGAVLERVVVDGYAEWRADFVLTPVELPDVAFVVLRAI